MSKKIILIRTQVKRKKRKSKLYLGMYEAKGGTVLFMIFISVFFFIILTYFYINIMISKKAILNVVVEKKGGKRYRFFFLFKIRYALKSYQLVFILSLSKRKVNAFSLFYNSSSLKPFKRHKTCAGWLFLFLDVLITMPHMNWEMSRVGKQGLGVRGLVRGVVMF